MSRSHKKFPGFANRARDCYKDKRNANKAVRHTKDIKNGMAYKRCSYSWDIYDRNSRFYSKREVVEHFLSWPGGLEIYKYYMK